MEYLDYGCRKVTEEDYPVWQKLFPVITDGYIVYEFNETKETIAGGFVILPKKEPIIVIHPNYKNQSLGHVIREFIKDIEKASKISLRGL